MKTGRGLLWIITLLVLFGLTLTACGSGATTASTATPAKEQQKAASAPTGQKATPASEKPSAEKPAAQPGPLTKVRIGEASPTVGTAIVETGMLKGFYKDEGLDVEVITIPNGVTRIQALVSGSVEFTGGTPEDVVRGAEKGLDTVVLAGVLNNITYSIVGQKDLRSIQDIKGKNLGSEAMASGSTVAMRMMLSKEGLEIKRDYNLLNVGGAKERIVALESGQVAAVTLPFPQSQMEIDKGFSQLAESTNYIKALQNQTINSTRSYAKKNPEVVSRFLRAFAKTLDWAYANKAETVKLLGQVSKIDEKYVAQGYDLYSRLEIWPRNGEPSAEGMQTMVQTIKDSDPEVFESRPVPNYEKYVDLSYIRDVQKQLKK